jgi:pimeloyl-ACP methyl ester carboxylesterase
MHKPTAPITAVILAASSLTLSHADGQSNSELARAVGIHETQIRTAHGVFRARVAGPAHGEVVILLHGFPQDSYEWRGPLRALATHGYRVVAPDQRGYSAGARPTAVADYEAAKLVGDITDIADAVGAKQFHLAGHDWGAVIAWGVAALVPERVLSLSTFSVPHPDAFSQELADKSSCQYSASAYFDFFVTPEATDQFVQNDFSELRAAYEGVSATDVDVYVKELGDRATVDAALNWYRANIANRMIISPPIGPIKVPTLFVWSDGDTALCRKGGELNRDFVDAPYRFEIIAGVNHWVVDNAPDQVSELLLSQLRAYPERRDCSQSR